MNRWLSFIVAIGASLSMPAWAAAPSDTPQSALHVLNRLGYGPTPGAVDQVTSMGVSRYIDQQLHPESIPLPESLTASLASLPGFGLSAADLFRQYGPPEKQNAQDDAAKEALKEKNKQLMQGMVQARILRATQSPRQLEEIMTEFWFNHFNVFEGKGLDHFWVQNFEDTAIRPYAMGRFRDLLESTSHHPAMLFYLDNWQSSAPGVNMPRRKVDGLNENYARELLELHTLGVNGGYTQDDVISLARILTGWTINRKGMIQGDSNAFWFNPRMHDPGDKTFLGKHIASSGEEEGEHALDMLAESPATAKHISYQLAQFFVADEPDPALVGALAQTYLRTHGDIRSVLHTLFERPEFWAEKNRNNKFKTPYEYAISSIRATGLPVLNAKPVGGFLQQAGQPVYGWQTPDGYKFTADAWINPDALLRRVNFATNLGTGHMPLAQAEPADASQAVSKPSPLDDVALMQTLGTAIGQKTRYEVGQSAPPLRAALILGSPDFMWR